jgi:hypothetical protein
MANILPIILAGSAVALLSGKKKKSKGGAASIPLDKPVQVKKDGLTVNSGRSPVPPAVYEAPLEPFEDVQQVQEALIAAGKPPKGGADGNWGKNSQAALDSYNADRGFKAEASHHLATPDSLRALHADAGQGTAQGVLANPQTGAGTTLFCSLSKGKCPSGQTCIPVFNTPIPGFEDVGYCVPNSMLEAGRKPSPEDYAPGGFNEVVFSPDYESVFIGGGWRFQTLEPWLYNRMKAGKLLTFALEGGLFWEDLISTSPKSFWNSTLASAGLAVPAGAAIGTKGWLGYRKAFRHEIFKKEMVKTQTTKKVRIWQGPDGFVPGAVAKTSHHTGTGPEFYRGKGFGDAGLNWPPPKSVTDQWAGWSEPKELSLTPREWTGGAGQGGSSAKPGTLWEMQEPGYGTAGGSRNPQKIWVELVDSEPTLHPGKKIYKVIGSDRKTLRFPTETWYSSGTDHPAGTQKAFAAESLDEAFKIARSETQLRSVRMIQLWSGPATEIVETGTKSKLVKTITWAKPQFAQMAKGIGAPMAVGAVIGGAIYGADVLAKKLGEKQRDLIAESAVLAWGTFASSNHVRVGNKKVRIDKLPESIAVQFFQAYAAQQIVRFQKSTYE